MHYLVGPPRKGPQDHLSQQRLMRLIPDLRERDVFLCGPQPMMVAASARLRHAGLPSRRIHLESFSF